MVTKVVAVRAGKLLIGRFCTEFRCEQLCDDKVFWDRARKYGPETKNAEIVTKVVVVRAGKLSIGRFCTEVRCEQLCDDGIFWNCVRKVAPSRFWPTPQGN